MTKDEVLRLALEAMEKNWFPLTGHTAAIKDKAITAIKQALSQPVAANDTSQDRVDETAKQRHEPEPKCVAIVEVFGKDWRLEFMSLPVGKHKLYTQQYTYTSPPKREPLTEQMTKQMIESCDSYEMRGAFVDGWLSAEAAHGIGEKK